MNGKVLASIVCLAVLILSNLGNWYLSSKSGYDKAITEISKESSLLVEQVRKEAEVTYEKHLNELAEYSKAKESEVRKVSKLQERLRKIQAEEPDTSDSVVCDGTSSHNDDVKWLFQQSVDSRSLSRVTDQPNPFTEETPTATYLLFAIEQYNSCSIQLNTLIDALE